MFIYPRFVELAVVACCLMFELYITLRKNGLFDEWLQWLTCFSATQFGNVASVFVTGTNVPTMDCLEIYLIFYKSTCQPLPANTLRARDRLIKGLCPTQNDKSWVGEPKSRGVSGFIPSPGWTFCDWRPLPLALSRSKYIGLTDGSQAQLKAKITRFPSLFSRMDQDPLAVV